MSDMNEIIKKMGQSEAAGLVSNFLLSYEPLGNRWRRGRQVRAQAKAEEQKVEYAMRMEYQEKRQRLNAIATMARERIEEGADPSKVDPDLREAFRVKGAHITTPEMQEFWARLMASEINEPGSFSLQTVNIVGNMDRRDAQSFASLCRWVWLDGGKVPYLVVFHLNGPAFKILKTIESLGLISLKGYQYNWYPPSPLDMAYGDGTTVRFTQVGDAEPLSVSLGDASLTRAGEQLFSIVEAEVPPAHSVGRCLSYWNQRAGNRYIVSQVSDGS